MKSGTWPFVIAVVAALLFEVPAAHAVWICHLPDGRSWQQEWPPCVKPADFDKQHPPPERQRPAASKRVAEPVGRPTQAQPTATNKKLYDTTVAELEARYPELNPDLPVFDQNKSSLVMANYAGQIERGLPPHEAVRAAVREVMQAQVKQPMAPSPGAPTSGALDLGAIGDFAAKGVVTGAALSGIVLLWLGAKWLLRAGVAGAAGLMRRGGGYLLPAFAGGVVGSFFGVAGFGGAISGALPGALIGMLIARAVK